MGPSKLETRKMRPTKKRAGDGGVTFGRLLVTAGVWSMLWNAILVEAVTKFEQVHISLGPTKNEMVVTYHTLGRAPINSAVVYGESKDTLYQVAYPEITIFENYIFTYRAMMSNLKPDTRYYYQITSSPGSAICEDGNMPTQVYDFRTHDSTADWLPNIAIYGDLGLSNDQSLPFLTNDVKAGLYDAIFHVGNFAYDLDERNGEQGNDFMNSIEHIAARVPYMACPGNRERFGNFSDYDNRFSMITQRTNRYISPFSLSSGNQENLTLSSGVPTESPFFGQFRSMIDEDLKKLANGIVTEHLLKTVKQNGNTLKQDPNIVPQLRMSMIDYLKEAIRYRFDEYPQSDKQLNFDDDQRQVSDIREEDKSKTLRDIYPIDTDPDDLQLVDQIMHSDLFAGRQYRARTLREVKRRLTNFVRIAMEHFREIFDDYQNGVPIAQPYVNQRVNPGNTYFGSNEPIRLSSGVESDNKKSSDSDKLKMKSGYYGGGIVRDYGSGYPGYGLLNQINNFFYSVNIGPAHIIMFTTEFYYYTNYGWQQIQTQFDFLERDLYEANLNRAEHPWIIVMGHRPLYCLHEGDQSCDYQGLDRPKIRQGIPWRNRLLFGLEDLFYRYGVDLQFYGHEHFYARSFPMYNYRVLNGTRNWNPYDDPDGPVHITTGNAGCRDHQSRKIAMPNWVAFHAYDYGYTRLMFQSRSVVVLEQVSDDLDGQVIDRIRIKKRSLRPKWMENRGFQDDDGWDNGVINNRDYYSRRQFPPGNNDPRGLNSPCMRNAYFQCINRQTGPWNPRYDPYSRPYPPRPDYLPRPFDRSLNPDDQSWWNDPNRWHNGRPGSLDISQLLSLLPDRDPNDGRYYFDHSTIEQILDALLHRTRDGSYFLESREMQRVLQFLYRYFYENPSFDIRTILNMLPKRDRRDGRYYFDEATILNFINYLIPKISHERRRYLEENDILSILDMLPDEYQCKPLYRRYGANYRLPFCTSFRQYFYDGMCQVNNADNCRPRYLRDQPNGWWNPINPYDPNIDLIPGRRYPDDPLEPNTDPNGPHFITDDRSIDPTDPRNRPLYPNNPNFPPNPYGPNCPIIPPYRFNPNCPIFPPYPIGPNGPNRLPYPYGPNCPNFAPYPFNPNCPIFPRYPIGPNRRPFPIGPNLPPYLIGPEDLDDINSIPGPFDPNDPINSRDIDQIPGPYDPYRPLLPIGPNRRPFPIGPSRSPYPLGPDDFDRLPDQFNHNRPLFPNGPNRLPYPNERFPEIFPDNNDPILGPDTGIPDNFETYEEIDLTPNRGSLQRPLVDPIGPDRIEIDPRYDQNYPYPPPFPIDPIGPDRIEIDERYEPNYPYPPPFPIDPIGPDRIEIDERYEPNYPYPPPFPIDPIGPDRIEIDERYDQNYPYPPQFPIDPIGPDRIEIDERYDQNYPYPPPFPIDPIGPDRIEIDERYDQNYPNPPPFPIGPNDNSVIEITEIDPTLDPNYPNGPYTVGPNDNSVIEITEYDPTLNPDYPLRPSYPVDPFDPNGRYPIDPNMPIGPNDPFPSPYPFDPDMPVGPNDPFPSPYPIDPNMPIDPYPVGPNGMADNFETFQEFDLIPNRQSEAAYSSSYSPSGFRLSSGSSGNSSSETQKNNQTPVFKLNSGNPGASEQPAAAATNKKAPVLAAAPALFPATANKTTTAHVLASAPVAENKTAPALAATPALFPAAANKTTAGHVLASAPVAENKTAPALAAAPEASTANQTAPVAFKLSAGQASETSAPSTPAPIKLSAGNTEEEQSATTTRPEFLPSPVVVPTNIAPVPAPAPAPAQESVELSSGNPEEQPAIAPAPAPTPAIAPAPAPLSAPAPEAAKAPKVVPTPATAPAPAPVSTIKPEQRSLVTNDPPAIKQTRPQLSSQSSPHRLASVRSQIGGALPSTQPQQQLPPPPPPPRMHTNFRNAGRRTPSETKEPRFRYQPHGRTIPQFHSLVDEQKQKSSENISNHPTAVVNQTVSAH